MEAFSFNKRQDGSISFHIDFGRFLLMFLAGYGLYHVIKKCRQA